VVEGGEVIEPLGDRILGRTAAVDIVDPISGEVVVPAGKPMYEPEVDLVTQAGVQEVMIRSVLTCEAENGVCGHCYGRDLARGTPVNIGEAIGVIAAQSIGEPGTQLTMRTFHIGGTAQFAERSSVDANTDGSIKINNRNDCHGIRRRECHVDERGNISERQYCSGVRGGWGWSATRIESTFECNRHRVGRRVERARRAVCGSRV
jgi:hypothetical protein